MRAVLALALVLLVLAAALEGAAALRPSDAPERAGRALAIVAAAKGPMLPAGTLPGGRERVGETIRIGELLLPGDGREGLRAALVDARGARPALRAHETFDVARSADAARALADRVAGARPGDVLVLASTGTLRPAGADADEIRAELAEVLASLGARARPGSAERESWAWVGLRRARGWTALAEGWSDESGVVLAFLLAPDHERYRDHAGELVHVRAPREVEVELAHELGHAERSPGVAAASGQSVGGRALPGIVLAADEGGAPGRVAWRDIELGAGSGFVAWVGVEDAAAAAGAGAARLAVRVDGETVARQDALPGAPWRALQVDLRAFAGRRATLELVVEPLAGTDAPVALVLGHPLLVQGYERAPLEALAERR